MRFIVKSMYEGNRPMVVLLASIVTSTGIVIFFLVGTILTNVIREKASYTQVDILAGSFFVFIITMIISLSLWPKVIDWLEIHKKN